MSEASEPTPLEAAEARGARLLRGANAPDFVFGLLDDHHGIPRGTASDRLHSLKAAGGLGPADNVVLSRTGDVFDEATGDLLGMLTESGA